MYYFRKLPLIAYFHSQYNLYCNYIKNTIQTHDLFFYNYVAIIIILDWHYLVKISVKIQYKLFKRIIYYIYYIDL